MDSDFCYDRVGEVIEYVRDKYGEDHVCKIGTFGTLGARAVIKDVARVFEYPYEKINQFTKQIVGISVDIEDIFNEYGSLIDKYEKDEDGEVFKRIMTVSKRLEGLQRHTSQHAAGVIISPFPLTDLVPLKGDHGDLTSQWEMHDIELLGFVKMDFLRLRTLTVIKNTTEAIYRSIGDKVDIGKIDFNDEAVFEEFKKGNTLGIFQFESAGMSILIKKNKPSSIEDLTALNALYRPGPLDAKVDDENSPHYGKTMVDLFTERASGKAEVEYDHPLLENVLSNTNGIITYQEQIMNASVQLAGFSLPDADELRKVVAKKLADKMPVQHEKFKAGCIKNQYFIDGCGDRNPADVFEHIWKQIETFARYGFPKAHACAYAILAYQSMWLKVHYPAYFMASVLTSWMGKVENMIPYLNECRRMGIKILPPDINQSSNMFEVSIDGDGIHFGLTGIQGVGERAVQNILEIKSRHEIRSLLDFITLTNSSVNKTVVYNLIKCGAFDFLEYNRKTLLKAAEDLIEIYAKVKARISSNKNRKKPVEDISIFYEPLYEYKIIPLDEFSVGELCQMEKELTGFYMSHHPLDGVIEYIKSKTSYSSLEINEGDVVGFDEIDGELVLVRRQIEKGRMIITGGVIKSLSEIAIKSGRNKGKLMCSFVLEDAYQGDIKCTAFCEVYAKYKLSLQEGNAVFIQGNVDYYRDNPQINVSAASIVNRDVASDYNVRHKREELLAQLKDIEHTIKLAEETIDIIGDDYELIGAVSDELIVLYQQRDEIKDTMEEFIV